MVRYSRYISLGVFCQFCFLVGKVWYLLAEDLKIALYFIYSTRNMDNEFFVHQI